MFLRGNVRYHNSKKTMVKKNELFLMLLPQQPYTQNSASRDLYYCTLERS